MSHALLSDRAVPLTRFVARTRAGLVATVLAAGLLLVVAAAVGWVAGGIILDLAAPLPVAGRVAVFGGWWLAVAAATAAFLLVPALRRPSLDTVAILIERALGGMHNRLLTVIDLARGGPRGRDARPEMVERLVAQTTARLEGYRSGRVIRTGTAARNLGLAALAAAALGGLFLAFGERFSITLARLLDPTADIPPATWLTLESPGPLEVLEGEPLAITCDVTRGEVDAVRVVMTSADGGLARFPGRGLARYPLRQVAPGRFVVTLDGLDEDATYRLEGGPTWTRTHPITVLRRPLVERVDARIRLPAYMRIDEPLPVDPDASRIAAPLGSVVEFLATVTGDVAEGGVRLLERTLERREVERIDERVWFEDDLPRDAVSETPWRWTTATTAVAAGGGLRAFTFDHGSTTLSMRTRLEPLVLPKDGLDSRALAVQSRIDPVDPPRALAMELEAEGRRLEVLWGDPAAVPETGARRLVAGPLPTTNEWTRLEAPLAGPAAEIAGRGVTGLAFRVDAGRVMLDRPGWLSRRTEMVDEPTDTPVGEAAAARGDDGSWLTSVPVDAPRLAMLEFRSPQGHASLPRPAVEIVPTVDRPPSLSVHEPQDRLSLPAAVDVEVVAEAFDDWGLDEVGFQSGPDAEQLGPRRPLPGVVLADRPPELRRDIRAVLDADALGLAAGRTTAWRLYVRDTKGQITDGPIRTISVVRPPEQALADMHVPAAREAAREARRAADETRKHEAALDEARRRVLEAVGAEPLARIDEAQAAAETAERAAEQAAEADAEAREQAEQARDEARTAAAERAQQAQAATDQAVAAFEPPAQAALAEAEAMLDARREQAARLAEAVTQAAAQARQSPLVPDRQALALDALAERAADLARSLEKGDLFAGETAKVERVADAPSADDVAGEAAQIAAMIEQLAEAIDAEGAIRRLDALAEDLGARAEALDALAEQAHDRMAATPAPADLAGDMSPTGDTAAAGETPQADTAASPPPQADMAAAGSPPKETATANAPSEEAAPAAATPPPPSDIAAAADDLAAAAAERLAQLERILGTPLTAASPAVMAPAADEMAAGERATGDAAGEDAASDDGASQNSASQNSAADDGLARDRAGEAAAAADRARAADRATDGVSADASATADTADSAPRERAGPAPLADPLRRGADEARQAAATAAALAEELSQRTAAVAESRGEAAAAAEADLVDTLGGEPVRSALEMAERARALAVMEAALAAAGEPSAAGMAADAASSDAKSEGQTPPGDAGRTPGMEPSRRPTAGGANLDSAAETGVVPIPETRRGVDPAWQAAIERLPPHVRDPLLEGMRQRGPEAYRGVIEAYFRRLGEEMPR